MMTIEALIRDLKALLEEARISDPRRQAEWIVSGVLRLRHPL